MPFFTGERIIPGQKILKYTYLRHEVVYRHCLSLVKDRAVLDCGCGEGYGASLLASRARSVMGIDRAASVIKRARMVYAANNISFSVENLEKGWSLNNASYDIATSFQVIEHLKQSTNMLHSMKRVLRPSGFAIISTPNRLTFSPTGDILDPYHVQEYDQQEYADLLTKVFPQVHMYALTGNDRIMRLMNRDIKTAKKIVRADVLGFRKFLPNIVLRMAYALALNTIRRKQTGGDENVELSDFQIVPANTVDSEKVLDFIAVCGGCDAKLPELG